MIRHRKSNKLFIISVINLVIGITLFTYNSVYDYYLNMLDKNKVDNYISNSKIKVNIVSIDNENTIDNEEANNYLGIISIPKINLEQGFYGIDNPMNNVDKNIELVIQICLM